LSSKAALYQIRKGLVWYNQHKILNMERYLVQNNLLTIKEASEWATSYIGKGKIKEI
jgi:hypothetical protein